MTATMKESDEGRVFFVNYRWLNEWMEATSSESQNNMNKEVTLYCSMPHESLRMANIFSASSNSELGFDLIREDSIDDFPSSESKAEGHHYALLSEGLWRRILKWHRERECTNNELPNGVFPKEDKTELLRLSLIASEQGKISFKISETDNDSDTFKRASQLFNLSSKHVYIWDISGQIRRAVANNENKNFESLDNQDMLLELHFYGIWKESNISSRMENGSSGSELALVPLGSSVSEPSLAGGSMLNRTNSRGSSPDLSISHPLSSTYRSQEGISGSNSAGLIGLHNLGNTCFMNSALQCLVHTPKLVEYFMGDYSREINRSNPLGMEGELALAFGELLRKLWAIGRTPIAPRLFKAKLARFAPQFNGYNQHDSQELLAFLLDGLHEDLNRVKDKPYIESKDSDGRPDEELADEYWRNHLARNDSIIVDLFQGQFKSTLVCPKCNKVSVTFDPFMYLSLPLPSNLTRPFTVTVISTAGSAPPTPYTVTVPKQVKCRDLVQTLSNACSLRHDEKLLLAEIYNNKIARYLEEPYDLLHSIRDDQQIVAYRLQKEQEEGFYLEFMNCRQELRGFGNWKIFSVPLITKRKDRTCTGFDIQGIFLNLISPLLREQASFPKEENDNMESTEDVQMEEANDSTNVDNGKMVGSFHVPNGHSNTLSATDFLFYFIPHEEKAIVKEVPISLTETLQISPLSKKLQVFVHWTEEMLEKYDIQPLENLSEGLKFTLGSKKFNQESISLYACLEAFLTEESLAPEDMWYCPRCKDHCQASKKLDLWRLPEILVVHLKRFSFSRFLKNKLETFVNFPSHDLDLRNYISHKNESQSTTYELYAISNHYGSLGGGHYTAYVKLIEEDKWYSFDDSHVSAVSDDRIKTSAAYVLFYRRVRKENYPRKDTSVIFP